MRGSLILLAVVLGLAACAPMPSTDAGPSAAIEPLPPQGSGASVGLPRAPGVVARDFVTVVNILEPVAERECRVRQPRFNCDFNIIVDDRPGIPPNAFQTVDRNGRPIIAFTLSLLAETANRDEIAFVMAHEAAHHIAGHLDRQRQVATVGAVVFGQLAGVFGADTQEAVRSAQEMGAAVGARRFSREFELEADALGTIIAARAGFDPVRGAEFFWRIPDPGNQFLGTHPPNAERVAVVRRTAAGL